MRRHASAKLAPPTNDCSSELQIACRRLAEGDQEAERICEELLRRDPDPALALAVFGNVALARGQVEAAIGYLSRSLASRPGQPAVLVNLGEALRRAGRQAEAIALLRHAATAFPGLAEAHYNLALALCDAGFASEAAAAIQMASQLKPALDTTRVLAEIKLREARAHAEAGLLDCAVAGFEHAAQLMRDARSVSDTLHELATSYFNLGRLDEALDTSQKAIEACPSNPAPHSDLVFFSLYDPRLDAKAILRAAIDWRRRYVEPLAILPLTSESVLLPERRLRIGYVSADFAHHVSTCFTRPLLANHGHADFEIYCYSDVKRPDAWTAILRGYADHWRDITVLSDGAVADLVRQDRVDILVDLSLHIADSRPLIFAHKPAPIQLCWLGYPGTTGQDTIDYRVSDPHLDPNGTDESVYTEQTIRLPNSFWCYDPLLAGLDVSPLPQARAGVTTFGALNSFAKVNAGVLALWARVLRAVADSRLMLLVPSGEARRRVSELFEHENVDAERLEFVDRMPRREYFALYARIDIGLDPFPYNGHTTSFDAFYMGVPVVTLKGQTAVGRAGTSIASNLGLPELVANDEEEYVWIARALACDPERLLKIREGLRERMRRSPLMDAPRFARDFEALYRDVWRRFCHSRESRGAAVLPSNSD